MGKGNRKRILILKITFVKKKERKSRKYNMEKIDEAERAQIWIVIE